jgi:tetratricopeptide (TPR) repeat protein
MMSTEPDASDSTGSGWWLGFWASSAFLYWWTARYLSKGDHPVVPVSGRIDRELLDPILDELHAALPRPSEDLRSEIRRCERTIADLVHRARDAGERDSTSVTAALAEQIAIREKLRGAQAEGGRNAVVRAWTGALVDPDANRALCAQLGALLLPQPLRQALTIDLSSTVIVAPSPVLAAVPWELLIVDGADTRVIERAKVLAGISPAHLVNLPTRERPRQRGVVRIVDPTGRRAARSRSSIYPDGVPRTWSDRTRPHEDRRSDPETGCTADELGELLSRHPRRLLYLGHVSSDREWVPTRTALELAGDATSAPRLTAHAWLSAPGRWPAPPRVALIACQSDDAGFDEQAGLAFAAIHAGARLITTTRWSLPTDASEGLIASTDAQQEATTALAVAVDDSHDTTDAVSSLRAWQLDQLRRWRTATDDAARRAHAPLLWAALSTYEIPESATVQISAPVHTARADSSPRPQDVDIDPRLPESPDTPADAHRVLAEGNSAFLAGDWTTAGRCYRAVLPFFLATGDEEASADTITNLGNVAWRRGRFGDAEAYYADALDRYRALGATWQVPVVVQNRGNVAYHRGNLDQARSDYLEAADRLTAMGEYRRAADALVNLSAFSIDLGLTDDALQQLSTALSLYRDNAPPDELPRLYAEIAQNRGLTLVEAGRLNDGRTQLARALDDFTQLDHREKVATLQHDIALCAVRQGDLGTALDLYRHVLAYYTDVQDELAAADCHLGLGTIALRQDRPEDAQRHTRAAMATYDATEQWLAAARAEHNLGLAIPDEVGLTHLTNAWATVQAMYWRLPDLTERASWRQTITRATDNVLDAAHRQDAHELVAELIESSRVAGTLRPGSDGRSEPGSELVEGSGAALLPHNDAPTEHTLATPPVTWSPGNAADHLACSAPPLIDCGWPPVLKRLGSRRLPGADASEHLRHGTVAIRTLFP